MTAACPWVEVKDGNPAARALFGRHYTYNPRRQQMSFFAAHNRNFSLFAGPGEKIVLLTPCQRALFVWRKFICADGETGVNCSVFRNEGAGVLSSELIRAADAIAFERWPGQRHFTYVNPRAVRSANPGYCFIRAGWRRLKRLTKARRLMIFEILPVVNQCQ